MRLVWTLRAGLSAALTMALCAQCFAQTMLPSQDQQLASIQAMYPAVGAGCKVSTVVTYDIRGYWFPGSIRVCQQGIQDVSVGDDAAELGQQLFSVNGRMRHGSLYSLVRGYPNTAYTFPRLEYGYETYLGENGVGFGNMVVTLPFVPYALWQFQLAGITRYAYSDLRIPPGMEGQAYPLKRDSIILRVDGYFFEQPNGLMTMMRYAHADNPYVEVEYVQPNEDPNKPHSAFIPLIPVSQAGAGWQALARGSHITDVDSSGHYAVGFAAALVFLGLWYAAESSGFLDAAREQAEQCRAMQRSSRGQILC